VVRQSRRLRRRLGWLNADRDGRSAGADLAFDSHDCTSKKRSVTISNDDEESSPIKREDKGKKK
jgi:hypothetical protein